MDPGATSSLSWAAGVITEASSQGQPSGCRAWGSRKGLLSEGQEEDTQAKHPRPGRAGWPRPGPVDWRLFCVPEQQIEWIHFLGHQVLTKAQCLRMAHSLSHFAAAAAAKLLQSSPTLSDPMDRATHQAPPSMGFSRQEYWSGVPLPSPPFRISFHSIFIPLELTTLIRRRAASSGKGRKQKLASSTVRLVSL